MKRSNLMKYWQQEKPPTLMEALVRKHHLLNRGFQEAGVSSVYQTAPNFNKELMKRLKEAEEVALVPVFELTSVFLGGQEKIVEGTYRFFAVFPEEEKIPDTLPGGFQVNLFRTIKRKLPSELLYVLSFERLGILYENIESLYFEPNQKENEKHKFKHTLSIEDIILLSRMENNKAVDVDQFRSKHAVSEERNLGKRLDRHLSRSPLVTKVSRSSIYTLSQEALDGMYAAVVHKKHLPEGFKD